MQIKILDNFIRAYKNAYEFDEDESFSGTFRALCKKLDEPFMHLSTAAKRELQELIFSLSKNINVAIMGQFSSGKSSLLNLILKQRILPTGAVPVTFRPSFLHFGEQYFLKIVFKNGREIITNVEKISEYTDQRSEKKNEQNEVSSLHIFAPIPLLKKITLIDTPGLNANEEDSGATLAELKNIHAIIWLSLIDNAGKKSEEDTLRSHLELLGKNSLCALNQKDKLSSAELERVMEYVREGMGKYFKDTIALSCKEAREAKNEEELENSGFGKLIKFLEELNEEELKENFAKNKFLKLCEILESENELFKNIFERTKENFRAYEKDLSEAYEEAKNKINILNHQILEKLKGIGERISTELFTFIKERDAHFFKNAHGLFKKNLYERYDYKAPFISSDDAFLAMFYHSDTMRKEFKKIKNELAEKFEELKNYLNEIFERLNRKILILKAEFSNLRRDDELQSELNFAWMRAFFSGCEEYFLKDYKNLLFLQKLELDLFFEKLNLKALANYENATKLSLNFFETKINASRVLYEMDSSEFALFYPKKSEIYERVLLELNMHEFEDLLNNKPILNKIIKNFFDQAKDLNEEKIKLINHNAEHISKRGEHVLSLKAKLKELG